MSEVKYSTGDVVMLTGQSVPLTVVASSWRITKVVWFDLNQALQEAELPTVALLLVEALSGKAPEVKKPKDPSNTFPMKFKKADEYQEQPTTTI